MDFVSILLRTTLTSVVTSITQVENQDEQFCLNYTNTFHLFYFIFMEASISAPVQGSRTVDQLTDSRLIMLLRTSASSTSHRPDEQ